MDSGPQAAVAIGAGMARDIATRMDQAFFGPASAPAQAGLGAPSGVQTVRAAGAFTNLDAFAGAISKCQTVGANVDAFVCSPATALTLMTVKPATGSNSPLLGQDGTEPTARQILGITLYVSPAVSANTVWCLDRSRIYLVVREDSTVEADGSVFFTSDRVAIRGVTRVGFGCGHSASIVKVTNS